MRKGWVRRGRQALDEGGLRPWHRQDGLVRTPSLAGQGDLGLQQGDWPRQAYVYAALTAGHGVGRLAKVVVADPVAVRQYLDQQRLPVRALAHDYADPVGGRAQGEELRFGARQRGGVPETGRPV